MGIVGAPEVTIHYHGTPITPNSVLEQLSGRHFCVSFSSPYQADRCAAIGQSCMWDNGAFSVFTKGRVFDEKKLYKWIEPRLHPPHWAVVLDAIGGDEEVQRTMVKRWPFPRHLSAPVWHLHLSLDYLRELCQGWSKVCFGSSAEYWEVGSDRWARRVDEAFEAIESAGTRTWVHMLRGSAQCGRFPFASVDSTNVARNHHLPRNDAVLMAHRIDRMQCPMVRMKQRDMYGGAA